jgi:hypothetical protein
MITRILANIISLKKKLTYMEIVVVAKDLMFALINLMQMGLLRANLVQNHAVNAILINTKIQTLPLRQDNNYFKFGNAVYSHYLLLLYYLVSVYA